MSASSKRAPSPYLLDPRYWRSRLAKLDEVQRGLLLIPRPDLSSPAVDVVEWRLRAHDGTRLWGLRGSSPFHPHPKGAAIREVGTGELPEIDLDAVTEGRVDFVFQVPAGRRLEDRVLDLVRVYQVALHGGLEPQDVRLVSTDHQHCPDEILIAAGLVERGLC
jgi:hypothetical protein